MRRLHLEELELRCLLANVFTVTTAADVVDALDAVISLREAILGANTTANQPDGPDRIEFAIPASDLGSSLFFPDGHVYYVDDLIPGQVTLANVDETTAATDAAIPDADPDYPRSWFSIQPASELPSITQPVMIDGYSQSGASPNTNPPGQGLNSILLVELNGSFAGFASGLAITAGSSVVQGLVINGFSQHGIAILTGGGNRIAGNFIGTNINGSATRPNDGHGVDISSGSTQNVIGTDGDGSGDLSEGNLISGNSRGVAISGIGTDQNVVAGNLIGLDASGTVGFGNNVGAGIGGGDGVWIVQGAQSNRVGTNGDGVSDELERNVIAGHSFAGVAIYNANTNDNVVAGNFLGTDVTGTAARGNQWGVALQFTGGGGPMRNRVGTNHDGLNDFQEGNLISGNEIGVLISGIGADRNVVAGNTIGPDVTGMLPLGNLQSGVDVRNGVSNNLIGTLDDPFLFSNLIAFNTGPGVAVGAGAIRNSIRLNSIHTNGGLGIDLTDSFSGFGVTPNDSGSPPDADSGGNELQNFPELLRFFGVEGRFFARLESTPNSSFQIEVYVNDALDPTGFGEGQRLFLRGVTVDTDNTGQGTFDFFVGPGQSDKLFTVTATDSNLNTSEFSLAIEAAPIASVADVTVTEGNDGIRGAELTITLSKPWMRPVVVGATTVDDTATASDADFGQLQFEDVVTFAPGETLRRFTVPIRGDLKTEADESFRVLLGSFEAEFVDGSATVVITNDDASGISINDASIEEGNTGQAAPVLTIGLTNPVDVDVSFAVNTADGAAKAGEDYQPITSPLVTIRAGETTAQTTVTINGDRLVEADETFFVQLTQLTPGGRNVRFDKDRAEVAITNNDVATFRFLRDVSQNEGDEGSTTQSVFNVELSNPIDKDVTLVIATSESLESPNRGDYEAIVAKTVTFSALTTVLQVSVPVRGDRLVEHDETFFVRLSNVPANARSIEIGPAARGTIANDDQAVLSVAGVTQAEGTRETSEFVFRLTLSNPVDVPVSVLARAADRTAVAQSDYQVIETLVTFEPGQTEVSVTVSVVADEIVEFDEAFELLISDLVPRGDLTNDPRDVVFSTGSLESLTATGLILNDDILPEPPIVDPAKPTEPTTQTNRPQLPSTFQRSGPAAFLGFRPNAEITLGGGYVPYQPRPPRIAAEEVVDDGQEQRVTKASPKSVEDSAMLLYGADAEQPRLLSIDYGDPPPRPAALESQPNPPGPNRLVDTPDPKEREVLKPSLEPDVADDVAPSWRTPALWGSLACLFSVGWLAFRHRARERK